VSSTNDAGVALAHEVVNEYPRSSRLVMALVAGSVARGLADGASDVDIYLYCDRADRDAGEAWLGAIGGRRLFAIATPSGCFEKYRVGDRFVDVERAATATLDDLVAALHGADPLPASAEKTAAGLRDAIALTGADALAEWRGRLVYPETLARAQAAAHLPMLLSPLALWRLTLARGDWLSFAARVSDTLLHGVALLGAVNHTFLVTTEPKWLPWQLDRLVVRPERMMDRMNEALSDPTIDRMRDLGRLLDEIVALVDAHIEGVDTSAARFALALQPPGE
jgi:hypothetical protein